MRKALCVAVMLLALACPVYAGDMQNDAVKPPPPPTLAQIVITLLGLF
jgi:hypothetical protein